MQKEQNEAVMLLVANLIKQKPNSVIYAVVSNCAKLQKLASSLHKRYEAACSYDWANTEAYVKRTEKLEAKATALGQEVGLKIEHQRDPRGWPLICKLPDDTEIRIG